MTNETRRGVFHFDRNIDCCFSYLGDSTLVLRRFVHAAGFGRVPRSAAGMEARPPGGDRQTDHPDQQQHDASYN